MRTLRATGLSQSLIQDWVVVRLPAEAGWNNFAEIREAMCDALHSRANGHHTGVVIDFTGTALTDSSALVSLARTCTRAELMDCPMRIVIPAMSVQLRHVLHTIGLTSVLPMFANVHTAVAAANPPPVKTDPAEMQRVLDALRMLRLAAGDQSSPYDAPADGESEATVLRAPSKAPGKPAKASGGPAKGSTANAAGKPPAEAPGKQDLRLEVGDHSGDGPLHLRLEGPLTRASARYLGDALTALVDRSLNHLRVDASATSGKCDIMPVLLGIRWRVAANGGCLHLPSPPAWLSRMMRREGLRTAFAACAACASLRRTTIPLDVGSRCLVLPEMIIESTRAQLGQGLVVRG